MSESAPPNCPALSIVIPAYQEEKRIGATLRELASYAARKMPGEIELIVVSAGSTDGTVKVAGQYENQISGNLTVLDLPESKGKGAAVRAGMLAATGQYILFTDADLAYEPELFDEFVTRLKLGADIVIAQRTGDTQYAGMGRRFVAKASRLLFKTVITPGIGDTQAGLKAFTRAAAKELFSQQTVNGFIFDVEILLLARSRKYRITKAFVPWQDKPGSTIQLRRDSLRAALDLVKIYWRLKSGKYGGSSE